MGADAPPRADTAPSLPRFLVLRVVVGGLLLAAYIAGACHQAFRINIDIRRTDQDAYVEYARRMAVSGYAHVGDRARMPLYPLLMSLLYRPGMSDQDFFRIGKACNIAMSVGWLALSWLLLAAWIRPLAATAIVSVAAFTVFMFKAGHFQAELLFYFLNLVLFVLLVENLLRPTAARAAMLGIVAGLAHLTKASVVPAVLLFLVCSVGRAALQFRRRGGSETARSALHLALFLATFLAVLFPYISTSKVRFGRWFYNVTSTFYVWYDSWDEVEKGTKAHGDRIGWPTMPESEIPSAAKYWREHSGAQIAARLGNGVRRVVEIARTSYGYFKYGVLYLVFLAAFAVLRRQRVAEALRRPEVAVTCFFAVAYFAGYLLLYAWYIPIAEGNRLVLSLFLPALAAIACFLDRVGEPRTRSAGWIPRPADAHRLVLVVLLVDLVFFLPGAITRLSGAD